MHERSRIGSRSVPALPLLILCSVGSCALAMLLGFKLQGNGYKERVMVIYDGLRE
jgi:hypothetical protein